MVADSPALRHDMYVYDDDDALVGEIGAFLADGLAAGDAALAVVDPRKWDVLRQGLGGDSGDVTRVDRDAVYTRPESAIATYDATLRRLAREGAPGVRAFAEVPPFQTPAQRRSWMAYEAIVNRALAHHPMWVICGYDARERSHDAVEHGWHTHRAVLTDGWQSSARYEDPAAVLRAIAREPEPLPPDLPTVLVDGELFAVRARLAGLMSAVGVPPATADDLLVATGEVLANAHRHAGGVRRVRAGRVGGRFVCEITDAGPGLDDPLAGHVPPRAGEEDAAGLWVARQLTQAVEVEATADGLSVRLWG